MATKKIVLTGGGTAGHVTPNIALLPELQKRGYEIHYVGSHNGIEKRLIEDYGVPYTGIQTGKLRRYFDPKNFSDPFRVIKGFGESLVFLRKYKPDVIFSKGGFVAVPVVQAAKLLKIPCIVHESDLTPGLANKLCAPAAKKICCNFPETIDHLPQGKAVLTGTPIRKELFEGDAAKGRELCGFDESKPVLLVMGGSLGAASVNKTVREFLPKILPNYQVVHITGKDKMDNLMLSVPGYKQFDFVKEELPHIMAMADVVISRAGANAISELLALAKPAILVPLPATQSRGDQILNAASFEKQGFSMVVTDDELPDKIISALETLYNNRQTYIDTMKASQEINSTPIILDLIDRAAAGEFK